MPGNVPGHDDRLTWFIMTAHSLLHFLHPWRRFLIAFSGGLDSTVLLHKLVLLRQAHPDLVVRAVHVHHGLSLNADKWVEHCQVQCKRWDVSLSVVRINVRYEGKGIEAQARSERYRIFETALAPHEALLTAQHQDDQCETVMLALKRGSGPAGLAAMPARLPFAGGELLRPLLHTTRYELDAWAQNYGLPWIEDESNRDRRFDRNFLRLDVLPTISARWPHFAAMAARSAQLCGQQEQLLDELLADELAALIDDRGTLRIEPLKAKSETCRAALLRRWFAALGADMPSRAALQRIWKEVALSREDASPQLLIGNYAIRRYKNALWRVKITPSVIRAHLSWSEPYLPLTLACGTLCTGQGQIVRAPRSDEPVSIRYRTDGLIHIVGRERGRSLKKLWQELEIPPWEREIIPLLFYGEQLIAAPGIFVTREGEAKGKDRWQVAWLKGNYP